MHEGVIMWKGPLTPTREECGQRLKEEGYNAVVEVHDPPGAQYQEHSHTHDECICVVEGSMEFKIAQQRYDLRPGDVLYLPKNTVHSAQVPHRNPVKYLIGHK